MRLDTEIDPERCFLVIIYNRLSVFHEYLIQFNHSTNVKSFKVQIEYFFRKSDNNPKYRLLHVENFGNVYTILKINKFENDSLRQEMMIKGFSRNLLLFENILHRAEPFVILNSSDSTKHGIFLSSGFKNNPQGSDYSKVTKIGSATIDKLKIITQLDNLHAHYICCLIIYALAPKCN